MVRASSQPRKAATPPWFCAARPRSFADVRTSCLLTAFQDGTGNRECSSATSRVILTAAHCVVSETGTMGNKTYAPRRSGYYFPWGSEATVSGIYPSEYYDNDCHINPTSSCSEYDYAVMVLNSSAWASGTPSWFGYWVPSTSSISGNILRHDGYATCDHPDIPSADQPATCWPNYTSGFYFAWGQNFGCDGRQLQ